MIPRSSLSYVLARRRPPTHLLRCPRWASPRHWRCARTQRHARAVPGTGFVRLSGRAKFYPGWRLGFRQSSFSHIARVPSARRPYASARPLVSWHALVPFTFQIQVSHQTQEYPPNPSRLSREYDRAPRGAGWSLVWYWFAGPSGEGRFGDGLPDNGRLWAAVRVGVTTDQAGDCRGRLYSVATAWRLHDVRPRSSVCSSRVLSSPRARAVAIRGQSSERHEYQRIKVAWSHVPTLLGWRVSPVVARKCLTSPGCTGKSFHGRFHVARSRSSKR